MDSNLLITILLAVFASSGFWTVIVTILQRKFSKDDAKDEYRRKLSKMLLGLGHDRICFLGMSYIDRGYITKDEYEDLITYLYAPYEELGGNGTAKLIIEKVQKLPVKKHADVAKEFHIDEKEMSFT